MLFEIKLRVKTGVLGDTWDDSRKIFTFPRSDSAWALDTRTHHSWIGLIENAITSLGVEVDPATFRLPSNLLLPSLHYHTRSYRLKHEKSYRTVGHEMIPRNVVLTLPVMILETDGGSPRNLRYPNLEQLHEIFTLIGQYEGISPFGSVYGWGRFTVQSIHPMGRNLADVGELSSLSGEAADIHGEVV